jgi:hypothetical protein
MFFGGAALVVGGAYLLLTRVSVVSGGWHFYGYNAFGMSLFPLLIGIGMLFYNGRSIPGWLLTAGVAADGRRRADHPGGHRGQPADLLSAHVALRYVDDARRVGGGCRPGGPLAPNDRESRTGGPAVDKTTCGLTNL